MKNILLFLFVLFLSTNTDAQSVTEQIKNNSAKFNLSHQLLDNWKETDRHSNDLVEFVYFQAEVNGIEVVNQVFTVVVKDGKVLKVNSPSNKINFRALENGVSQAREISAENAVRNAFSALKMNTGSLRKVNNIARSNEGIITFAKNESTSKDITAKKVYVLNEDGSLTLAWKVFIFTKDGQHAYDAFINAADGKLIKNEDGVVHCSFDGHTTHDHNVISAQELVNRSQSNSPSTATYNVFDLYIDSPLYGDRSYVTDPWLRVGDINPLSDNGWHSDGTTTYTSTRGNNVDAYVDLDDSDTPTNGDADRAVSEDYNFDFPFDTSIPQIDNKDAAVTNLFFWNNITHDVMYKYGFDEASGNFQNNNFEKGGRGNDAVQAQAQDGGGLDNANFYTPGDGSPGRMQMYNWAHPLALAINSPASLAGKIPMIESGFSDNNKLDDVGNVTGNLVLVLDAENDTNQGCSTNPLTNAEEIAGNIALIYRGECDFVDKAKNAQAAGAIGLLVVNNTDSDIFAMGGTDNEITIPAGMILLEDGEKIKEALKTETVEVVLDGQSSTFFPDGDFDNGIIVHEYGHGVSTRLTGGPTLSSCLRNSEQMGEGWSDFLGLMLTTDWEKATPSTKRAIGNFAANLTEDGVGIRRYPYSIDFSVNPFTYGDVADSQQSEPHGIGTVWATMLWELVWELEKTEGIDPDIYSGKGGNGIALQLVMDGMKLQPCSPGFVDGRDAILQADEIRYNGKYNCAIWRAFARRGLGVSADQGSSSDRYDGKEAFDSPEGIKLEKVANVSNVEKGDEVEYTFTATCECNDRSNVIIKDVLPTGLSHVEGGTFDGTTVEFPAFDIAAKTTKTFKFTAKINNDVNTKIDKVSYDFETGLGDWLTEILSGDGQFAISTANPNSGAKSIFGQNYAKDNDYVLISPEVLIGGGATLEFVHSYKFEASASGKAYDGAFVEVSIDGGESWISLEDDFTENGYNSIGSSQSSFGGLGAFSGDSNGYIVSKVSLDKYSGQKSKIRFRVDNDNQGSAVNGGWYIDDVTISSNPILTNTGKVYEGDKELGSGSSTISVKGENPVGVENENIYGIEVYPNPVLGKNFQIKNAPEGSTFSIFRITGELVQRGNVTVSPIEVVDLPSGAYLLKVRDNKGNDVFTNKLVK